MENNKKVPKQEVGPTPIPSLTSQLFGSQSSSSNDVFASIFPPSNNKLIGGNSNLEVRGNGNQPWNATQDKAYTHGDTPYNGSESKDGNSVYEQARAEPCYLSSSLYYGGQETYSNPSTHSTSTSFSNFKKDGGEDDSSGAARGNWWQGSLYY